MAYESIGKNNGSAGTERELFAKKFSTDVLRYFQDTNIAKQLITTKTIESGKSESFPVVGNAEALDIANDGEELVLQNLKATEREIVIGNMTVAHAWITDLDKAMSHYDSQSAQAESIGRALAKKVDKDIIEKIDLASQIFNSTLAANVGLKPFDDDIYTQTVVADCSTGAGVYNACVLAETERTSKDTVGEPVFLLRPAQYFMLLNNPAQTGLTWVNDPHAQSGKVPMLLGKKVVYSPHFAELGGPVAVAGERVGYLVSKEAVGMLELVGVSTRIDYIPTRLSNLIVGKMAVGYGILNHSCCIGIEQA